MPSKLVGCLTTKLVDLLDGLTCGPLKVWTTKLVDHLTAKLMNHLTTKLVNLLTAKLVNRLTAKLVVVNLVKLHLTKSIMIIKIIFNTYSSEKAIMLLFTDGYENIKMENLNCFKSNKINEILLIDDRRQ